MGDSAITIETETERYSVLAECTIHCMRCSYGHTLRVTDAEPWTCACGNTFRITIHVQGEEEGRHE